MTSVRRRFYEATSGLDPEIEGEMMRLFRSLADEGNKSRDLVRNDNGQGGSKLRTVHADAQLRDESRTDGGVMRRLAQIKEACPRR